MIKNRPSMPQTLSKKTGECACCERLTRLDFHHLIPRKNHKKPWFKRHFSNDEMHSRGIYVCKDCHRAIHRFFSEIELGKRYNTAESLLAEEAMQNFVAWVRKRPVKI